MKNKLLEAERQRKWVGAPEFAAEAARLLSELEFVQERGSVTDVPDERTIRYYLSEGLIQPPAEKQGTASVFGYLHLLQLLVVKKLQAEHLPIRKIRELVVGRSERQLERLLGTEEATAQPSAGQPKGEGPARNEATLYLESLLTRPSALPPAVPARALAQHLSTRSLAQHPPPRSSDSGASSGTRETWERIEIEPGLELHIRHDYQVPRESSERRSLLDRIARLIGLREE